MTSPPRNIFNYIYQLKGFRSHISLVESIEMDSDRYRDPSGPEGPPEGIRSEPSSDATVMSAATHISAENSDPQDLLRKTSENNERYLDLEQQKEKYFESNAGDGSKATDQHVHGIKLFLTLFSTVLALFASALDQTIVSTILTTVGSEFGSFEKVGWVTSGYLLPMAALAPSYGKISIAFGRKYTLMSGLGLFMIGSLVCALATSMDMLIGGRIIQGIGGGAIQAMVMVILSEVVPISKRSLSMSLIGITFSVASALGPFIGGSFTTHVTWRWCFYINLPIGGIGAVFLYFAFKPPVIVGSIKQKLATIDYLGTFFIVVGLVLVLLALTFGGAEYAWDSGAVILCFVLGGVFLIAFCVYNFRYSKNPIIIREAITVPQIITSCIAGFLAFIQFMVNIVYLALYYQVIQNDSAWQSGIHLLPFVITVSITSAVNGIFIRFVRIVKIPMVFCGATAVLGSGLLLLFDLDTSFGQGFGIQIVNGITAGLSFQSALLAAQLSTPNSIQGSLIIITAFSNFCKSVGGVIGISIGQVILQTTATSRINQLKNTMLSDPQANEILHGVPTSALVSNPRMINDLPKQLRRPLLEAFMGAFTHVFYFSIGVSSALLILTFFTTNKKIPKDLDVQTKEDDAKKAEGYEEKGQEDKCNSTSR